VAFKEVQAANSDAQVKRVPSDMVFYRARCRIALLALPLTNTEKASLLSPSCSASSLSSLASSMGSAPWTSAEGRKRLLQAVAARQQQHDPATCDTWLVVAPLGVMILKAASGARPVDAVPVVRLVTFALP
jgi:hypothetical protein